MRFTINITREQFLNFVKTSGDTDEKVSPSTQHYLEYFDQYQQTGKKSNWNWSAFWSIWFFFRRMYANAFLVMLLSSSLNKLLVRIAKFFSLGVWEIYIEVSAGLLLMAFMMRYADYIYLIHASKKISKGMQSSGTNKTAAGIVFFLLIFAIAVMTFLEL